MPRSILIRGLSLPVLGFVACVCFAADPTTPSDEIQFNRDIRPILFANCVTCHGPDEEERAAGLRLDTREGAIEDLGGYAAIVAGKPDESELISRVLSDDPDLRMPPPDHAAALEPEQVDLLRRWIEQDAAYAKHWSYELPVRPELPNVVDREWVQNPIDHFTLSHLEFKGWKTKPQADRLTLARRVALDLTGLPPTWEEAQSFVNDESEKAYERYVDAMLRKPAFGERWARVWLDLARYADSAGYADDPPRTIWAFRDYVIRSLNDNKPFDQFTIEQIAGDLLQDPTDEQLTATAFHRNTLTNNEGGTNDEEFRNVAVVDRVNTTMAVWMGTTMACAQCHTHKYDPLTQEEYFRLFAFFNNTEDADRRNESPTLEIWSQQQLDQKQAWRDELARLQKELAAPNEELDRERDQWLASLTSPPQWTVSNNATAKAKNGEIRSTDSGWLEASGEKSDTDEYTLRIPTSDSTLTALQIEVDQLSKANFVLSQVTASWQPETSQAVTARSVRVKIPGKARFLHLAELQAFSGNENVALAGKANQSSTDFGGPAERVNDGNTDGDFKKKSVTHTASENDPWIEVDFGTDQPIDRIAVWNRTDGGGAIVARLNGFVVQLLDADKNVVWESQPEKAAKSRHEYSIDGSRQITFGSASADHEQTGFPASSVIATKMNPKTGWAVAPKTGEPHRLTLVLQSPLPVSKGNLTLRLKQQSIHKGHLIDRFRVSVTQDESIAQWAELPANVFALIQTPPASWSADQKATVDNHYRSISPRLRPKRDRLESVRGQLDKIRPQTTVPVLRQLADNKRRSTKIQIRGNYLMTGDEVSEGTPTVFHELRNQDAPTRLDLAHWLVDPNNPLTARVIANRHWEQLFGIGIVESSEEFGSQGSLPTHPELLDWLAVELQQSGWDLKHLIRLIVTSATYRQSSVAPSHEMAEDPGNRHLARGPRFRISAEMVRDQALAVSGLLSDKMYGAPVKPPQPQLGLTAAFGSTTDWKTSSGEDRYRRGIYTTWRRSSPYPSMAQFDAPNREVCTVRRIRTNTPLQALVTLNDPVYIEAAQSLSRHLVSEYDESHERIRAAFQRVLIREPSAVEVERLTRLVESAREHFADTPDDAMTMATAPLGGLPEGADVVEHAAWTIVGNVLLNLDELFLKR